MVGRDHLLCLERVSHHFHPARDARQAHFLHKFHARRALRIWPVYALVLAVCYQQSRWFIGPPPFEAIKAAPWLAYIFFVQNLFHITLPPAIGPTWALAIEEQYYFFWAPAVRVLRRPWILAVLLTLALIASPLLRHLHYSWLTPTHTLIHLDGIALGSLLALGLYTLPLSRRVWLGMGLAGLVLGIGAAATVAAGTAFSIRRWPSRLPARCWPRSPPPAPTTRSTPRSGGVRWLSMAASATAST